MLKKITVRNVFSIGVTTLDFSKGNYQYEGENILGDAVNPIAIYGHNGSGKSSFLNALAQFISLLVNPVEQLAPFVVNDLLFSQYATKKNPDPACLIGSISLRFELEKSTFEYIVATSANQGITHERLTKGQDVVFERNGQNYLYHGEKRTLSPNDSPLVLLLRRLASSEITDGVIQTVFSYLTSFVHADVSRINQGGFVTSKFYLNQNIYDLLVKQSNDVKRILSTFKDFPIYSIEKDNKLPNGLLGNQYYIVLEDKDGFKERLRFQFISNGMRNASLLLSILTSLPQQSVFFIDELDIALHPSTIKSFIEVAREKKIQLVFSSHNTSAMRYLRPDQIYFAKWERGFSTLLRLSTIYPNIREVNNIEKMYLGSMFDEAINQSNE